MIAELSAALSAIKETTGLVKVINDAKNDAEIKAATFELQNKLLTLQAECFSLGDAIRSRDEEAMHLKAKIAEFEDFHSQVEGYALDKLDSGTFVYSKKQIVGEAETMVYLCPNCFPRKVISILQTTGETAYDAHTEKYFFETKCHNCSSKFSMNHSDYKPVEIGYF